jgi:hypothetical protein
MDEKHHYIYDPHYELNKILDENGKTLGDVLKVYEVVFSG